MDFPISNVGPTRINHPHLPHYSVYWHFVHHTPEPEIIWIHGIGFTFQITPSRPWATLDNYSTCSFLKLASAYSDVLKTLKTSQTSETIKNPILNTRQIPWKKWNQKTCLGPFRMGM